MQVASKLKYSKQYYKYLGQCLFNEHFMMRSYNNKLCSTIHVDSVFIYLLNFSFAYMHITANAFFIIRVEKDELWSYAKTRLHRRCTSNVAVYYAKVTMCSVILVTAYF